MLYLVPWPVFKITLCNRTIWKPLLSFKKSQVWFIAQNLDMHFVRCHFVTWIIFSLHKGEPTGEPNTATPNTNGDSTDSPPPSTSEESEEMHLVLRLRNDQRELHDIKFDFTVGKDTTESVSRELVEAGLVDGKDLVIMAANLDKIIEKREKQQIFRLNSGCGPNEAPCDKSLLGFAQLTLLD